MTALMAPPYRRAGLTRKIVPHTLPHRAVTPARDALRSFWISSGMPPAMIPREPATRRPAHTLTEASCAYRSGARKWNSCQS